MMGKGHKQREIDLTDIETERMECGFTVDICGQVNGYKFIIHFCYQGRINLGIESDLHGAKCGMIYISLDHFVDYWRDARDSNKTDRQLLNEFLSEDLDSETWVFHPRREKAEQQALSRLNIKIKELQQQPEKTKKWVNFQCLNCQNEWEGYSPGNHKCPKCGEHLFSKIKQPSNI